MDCVKSSYRADCELQLLNIINMQLFRYRTIDGERAKNELDALRNAYLYAGAFSNMNDPMEGVYQLDQFENSNVDAFLGRLGKSVDPINNMVRQMMDSFGLVCLTRAHPIQATNMWAYYTGDSNGFCVELDSEILAVGDFLGQSITEVVYSDEPRPPLQINDFLSRNMAKVIKVLSTKSKNWSTEQEIRYIIGASGKKLHYIDDALNKLYLGHKIKKEYRDEILTIFRNRKTSILQGRIADGKIVFDEIQAPCEDSTLEFVGAKGVNFKEYIPPDVELKIRNFLTVPYESFERLCEQIAANTNVLDDWIIGVSDSLFIHAQYRLRNGSERFYKRFFDRNLELLID